ncbi:MAG TPA: anti-sigma factor [Solirubrobacteraceae bacterium]|jgi:anti-sigma-K factor RskA
MTGPGDTQPTGRDCGDDVAAYALGALEPGEVDAFRRHLEQCAICRDELAAFEQVVQELPLAAEQHRAPESLRKNVLQAIDQEPKVAAGRQPRPARARRGWFALSRPALALTALVAAVVIAVGVIALNSGSAPTRVFKAQVTGSTGTAQVRIHSGRADLVVHDLQPPPAGKIYEVWLKRGSGAPQPTTALFSVTAKGDGDVGVPGDLHGVNLVLVTPEPAGGSRVPTHPPVITARLT